MKKQLAVNCWLYCELIQHCFKISRPYVYYFPSYKQLKSVRTGLGWAGSSQVPHVTVEGTPCTSHRCLQCLCYSLFAMIVSSPRGFFSELMDCQWSGTLTIVALEYLVKFNQFLAVYLTWVLISIKLLNIYIL